MSTPSLTLTEKLAADAAEHPEFSGSPKVTADMAPEMEVLPLFPSNCYTAISKVVSGDWGVVYLSLRKSDFNTAFLTKSTNTFEHLKQKLVAIKVFTKGDSREEVAALDRMQEYARQHSQHSESFIEVLDHDESWMAMRAVQPSLSIYDLYPCPRELQMHCFLEVVKILRFMHERCKPPVGHGDIHIGNAMIDLSRPAQNGFPQIVLIDFGNLQDLESPKKSKETLAKENESLDVKRFIEDFVQQLLQEVNRDDGVTLEHWDEYEAYVKKGGDGTNVTTFRELYHALADPIKESLDAVTEVRKEEIMMAVRDSAKEQEKALEASFMKLELLSEDV